MIEKYTLAGSPYDRGFQHGFKMRDRLRAFARDGLFRINALVYDPVRLDDLLPTIHAYEQQICRYTPELIDEVRGISDGAGILYEEALLLQIRREIIGYNKISTQGDCTSFTRNDATECVLAQTIDLNGGLDDQLCCLHCSHERDGRTVILLTFTGLVGYLGMNSHGVAIGLNLVLAGDWRPGVPPYLAIRHLLDKATCLEDCISHLAGLQLASSRSLMVCDENSAANVEIMGRHAKWMTGVELAHTNHYLDADLSKQDEINVFAKNSSIKRLQTCRSALARAPGERGSEQYFEILSQPPICVHPTHDIRREATVAAVVMKPRERVMYVRKGPPCLGRTVAFRL